MIELHCKQVRFYSPQDESVFFAWAEGIPGVVDVAGRGASIVLSLRSRRVSNAALRELVGLFRRYRLPMRQLAQFCSSRNESWFAAPDTYWHKAVFETPNDLPS